jgi:hypothetical protein
MEVETYSIGPKTVGVKIQNQLDLKPWEENTHVIKWTLK